MTTLPPTTIPDSYTGRCAEGLYPASYAPDAPCVTTDPCPSLAARQRGTWDDPAITEDKRIPYHTRKRPPYTPHLNTCRTTTEKFLNELADDGVGNGYEPGNRSAHWWVGCLASQLEYFLAATDPERAEPQQEIS